MNKSKFSFVKVAMAALLLATGLFFASCYFGPSASEENIYGDWVSAWGEKYSITENEYDNYYADFITGEPVLYYSTNNVKVVFNDDSTSGYIYCQFDDAEHVGYGAEVGQWYALYFQDLTETTVSFGQPYKADGKAGCASLKEAKKEYTIENGYFDLSMLSECVKQ